MIHLAMGLLTLSLTCVALSAVSYLAPGLADTGLVFTSGSSAALVVSRGFAAYAWRAKI